MFETIDNVTMINESTGAFPDAAHRPARRWPGAVLQGQYPLVLDALQAAGAAWHTAAPCLRPRLCIDLYDATCADELPSAQDIYNELKPLVGFIVAGELATTVKVGQRATRRRSWRFAPTIATARRREPRCAEEATDVRSIVVAQCEAVWRTRRFPGKFLYVHLEKLSRAECLFGFSQCSTRVGDLRLRNRSSQNIRVAKFVELTVNKRLGPGA